MAVPEAILLRKNLILWVFYANFHFIMSRFFDDWVVDQENNSYIDYYAISLEEHTGSTSKINYTIGKFIGFYHFFVVLFINIIELVDTESTLSQRDIIRQVFFLKPVDVKNALVENVSKIRNSLNTPNY